MRDARTAGTGRWQRHLRNFRFLVDGLGTGVAAWFVLAALLLCTLPLVTLPLLPRAARAAHALAALERRRTAGYLGVRIPDPPPAPGGGPLAVLVDPVLRRDAAWLLLHATVGTLAGVVALSCPLGAVQNTAIALVWPFVPDLVTTVNTPVGNWSQAGVALLVAAGYAATGPLLLPPLASWYLRAGAALLAPPRTALVERIAEVTATRAAALDAHGAELRRIERDLHDGVQNRLVAVVMHLGMAERALHRDPAAALPMVLTARQAADDALGDLRSVVRGIHPPVLSARGLTDALAGLAAHCSLPCTVEAAPLPPLPAAVEAAAYFAVAEALTNCARHSGARAVRVRLHATGERLVVQVCDDGHGGAQEGRGSGLTGIRRRVGALDGTLGVQSPPGGPTVLEVGIPVGS
ncbi:sensor histidine kinase [Kineococcus sp. NUM-3379]